MDALPFLLMVNHLFSILLTLSLFLIPMWNVSANGFGSDDPQGMFLARVNSSKKELHDCYTLKDKDEARSCIQQIRRREEAGAIDLRSRTFQTSSLPKNTRKDATASSSRRSTHCLALKNRVAREACAKNASEQKKSRRTTVIRKEIPSFIPNDQCGGLQGEERTVCINKSRVSRPEVSPPKSARSLKTQTRPRRDR